MVIKIGRINFTVTALTFFDGSSARYLSLPCFGSTFCQLDHCPAFPFLFLILDCPVLSLLQQVGFVLLLPIIMLRRTKNN